MGCCSSCAQDILDEMSDDDTDYYNYDYDDYADYDYEYDEYDYDDYYDY